MDRDSSSSLENTSCSIGRVPGFTYYKYRKEDRSSFLTTVSPRSWGPSCPHTFVKAYRETKSGVVSAGPGKATEYCMEEKIFEGKFSFILDISERGLLPSS